MNDLSADTCEWQIWADDIDYDVLTDCKVFFGKYDGDDLRFDVKDGDPCPWCGRAVKKTWVW